MTKIEIQRDPIYRSKLHCTLQKKGKTIARCFLYVVDNLDGTIEAIPNKTTQYIAGVYVNEEYRHQGYGTFFINGLSQKFSNVPFFLDVDKTNPMKEIAIKTYEKIGFQIIEDNKGSIRMLFKR